MRSYRRAKGRRTGRAHDDAGRSFLSRAGLPHLVFRSQERAAEKSSQLRLQCSRAQFVEQRIFKFILCGALQRLHAVDKTARIELAKRVPDCQRRTTPTAHAAVATLMRDS